MIGIVIYIHSSIRSSAIGSHFLWQFWSLIQPILLNEHLPLVHILPNFGKHLLILYRVNIKEWFFSSIIRIEMLISINEVPGSHRLIICMCQLRTAFQIVEMPCIVPFLVQWVCPIATLRVVFFQILQFVVVRHCFHKRNFVFVFRKLFHHSLLLFFNLLLVVIIFGFDWLCCNLLLVLFRC